jgi:hypothetical protein
MKALSKEEGCHYGCLLIREVQLLMQAFSKDKPSCCGSLLIREGQPLWKHFEEKSAAGFYKFISL